MFCSKLILNKDFSFVMNILFWYSNKTNITQSSQKTHTRTHSNSLRSVLMSIYANWLNYFLWKCNHFCLCTFMQFKQNRRYCWRRLLLLEKCIFYQKLLLTQQTKMQILFALRSRFRSFYKSTRKLSKLVAPN